MGFTEFLQTEKVQNTDSLGINILQKYCILHYHYLLEKKSARL